jgi:hypothetical protein
MVKKESYPKPFTPGWEWQGDECDFLNKSFGNEGKKRQETGLALESKKMNFITRG